MFYGAPDLSVSLVAFVIAERAIFVSRGKIGDNVSVCLDPGALMRARAGSAMTISCESTHCLPLIAISAYVMLSCTYRELV